MVRGRGDTFPARAGAVAMVTCLTVVFIDTPASAAGEGDGTVIPPVPGASAAPAPAPQTAIAPADSQRLVMHFDRIRRSSSVSIFQVDGWEPNCRPWTFPTSRVIDCHPVIQEVPVRSGAWRDSLIALLTAPGALIPPRASLCVCHDDVVVRFASDSETTTVWFCTGCATVGIPTPTAIMGFDFAPGPDVLRALVDSALHRIAYDTRLYFEPCSTAPLLIQPANLPSDLCAAPGAPEDTLQFEALIGRDGRVSQLWLRRGREGMADRVGPYVGRYVYRPGLFRDRPVAAVVHVTVPVPVESP